MVAKLLQEISKTIVLNTEDKNLCTQFFEIVKCTRNTVLEEQDTVPQFLYFVNGGFLGLFYYNDNGDEVTALLASPNGFIDSSSTLKILCMT